MAFSAFTNLDNVLRKSSLRQVRAEFVRPVSPPPPTEAFLTDLRFTLATVPSQRSG